MNKRYEYKTLNNKNLAALLTAGLEGWLVVGESEYQWTLMRELRINEKGELVPK